MSGDSIRVREQQFPVLKADLALPRTLVDSSTAPDGECRRPEPSLRTALSAGGTFVAMNVLKTDENVKECSCSGRSLTVLKSL